MDKNKIILLVIGAIIGFVVSLAKDWVMEGKKQKERSKQSKREKLEEIFILVSKLHKDYFKPIGFMDNIEAERLSMLIRFDFPSLENQHNKFIDGMLEITRLKLKEEDHLAFYFGEFHDYVREFVNAIVKESKNI